MTCTVMNIQRSTGRCKTIQSLLMFDFAPCTPHCRWTRFYKNSKKKTKILDYQEFLKRMAPYVQCFKYAFVRETAPVPKLGLDLDISQ